MEIREILTLASEFGLTPFNLVLIIMLYFMGAHSGIFPKLWGEPREKDIDDEGNPITLLSLYQQMKTLSSYFNHDTTETLGKITDKQERIHTTVEDIKRKHDEYDRFGIKIRAN